VRPHCRAILVAILGMVLSAGVFFGLYHKERQSARGEMQIAASELLSSAIIRSEAHFRTVQRAAEH